MWHPPKNTPETQVATAMRNPVSESFSGKAQNTTGQCCPALLWPQHQSNLPTGQTWQGRPLTQLSRLLCRQPKPKQGSQACARPELPLPWQWDLGDSCTFRPHPLPQTRLVSSPSLLPWAQLRASYHTSATHWLMPLALKRGYNEQALCEMALCSKLHVTMPATAMGSWPCRWSQGAENIAPFIPLTCIVLLSPGGRSRSQTAFCWSQELACSVKHKAFCSTVLRSPAHACSPETILSASLDVSALISCGSDGKHTCWARDHTEESICLQ